MNIRKPLSSVSQDRFIACLKSIIMQANTVWLSRILYWAENFKSKILDAESYYPNLQAAVVFRKFKLAVIISHQNGHMYPFENKRK